MTSLRRRSQPSKAMQEVLLLSLKDKRDAFGYSEANALVRMLIDQVIICQIRLWELEITYTAKVGGPHAREQGIYWNKRLNSAQLRFQRAGETLARVRKMLADVNERG